MVSARCDAVKPLVMRARWHGEWPQPGDYLRSIKATRAYQIIDVTPMKGAILGGRRLRIRVWPVHLHDIDDGARVHTWKWDARTKKAASLRRQPSN